MPDQYTIPHFSTSSETRLGWLRESVKRGETFLRNQTSWQDIDRAKQIIAGVHEAKIPQSLSKISVNLEKRLIKESVAILSNLRPLWGYSTDNPDLDKQAEILNKLLLNWYQTTFADRGIKKALQYATVQGTGYIGPDWHSDFWVRGRGDIVLKSYGPEDIIPDQVPKDGDLQRCYAVTIKEEVPINLARAMFPTFAHLIVPDRQAPSGLRKGLGRMATFLSPVLNRFAADTRSRKVADTTFPVVDVYQTYIMDLSINDTQEPIVMGEPGTYWNYTVPVLNSDIPDGTNADGTPRFRKATPEDCMLYPFRRLITWFNTCIPRDSTSYWWHGMVPAVPISLDKWAWEFLGYSKTRDLHSIEESNNSLRRAMDDSANNRLRPTLQYDDRTLSKSLMETLDTREPGKAVGVDFTVSEQPIRPLLPPGYYDIPPIIPALIQSNEEMMKYLSGVNDYTAITKAAQIPSSDTVEKIFDMAGPMVTDESREMEASLGKLGEMIKCMFFEFYTTARRLQIGGIDMLTPEDTEYFDPGNLVPSHMPTELPDRPSTYNRTERARKFMSSFFFKITPGTLHQLTQMATKLRYIQLQKIGIPIDPWTMAQVNDIPNFGRPPQGADTVFQKWVAWERIKGELTASIQAKVQEIHQMEQMKMVRPWQRRPPAGRPPGGEGPQATSRAVPARL